MNEQFQSNLNRFINELKEKTAYEPSEIQSENLKKFVRIFTNRHGVICFVALCDGQRKDIGQYKIGDIFYPQGWSSQAKHVRGNVFDEQYNCITKWGIKTLR